MRRWAPMKNNTMSNMTLIAGVLFAFPQAADRSLTVGPRGEFYAPTHKTTAFKDVAHLRSRRPPV
jgi:hypothetical protein